MYLASTKIEKTLGTTTEGSAVETNAQIFNRENHLEPIRNPAIGFRIVRACMQALITAYIPLFTKLKLEKEISRKEKT